MEGRKRPQSPHRRCHYGEKGVLVDFEEGDTVTVVAGPWKDTVGTLVEINEKKKTVSMMVEMFGRETKVELDFTEVKKM